MNGKCILCGEELDNCSIYVCSNMPAVSQNLPRDISDAAYEPIDLNLCQCSKCGLVQFDCNPVSYYKDSTRAGERSKALIELRQKQYKHLIETYNLSGKKIIELGAGKGGFLKTLKEMEEYAIKEYGLENNKEFVDIARNVEGVNVFWGDPENEFTKMEGAPYDAFISFSYPARLVEPNKMIRLIERNLVEDGVGLVMVPSLEHLLKPGGFFDIARDHIAYYSIDTLRFLFQKNNFDVLEYGEESKLYIYMIVRKRRKLDIGHYWQDVNPLIAKTKDFISCKRKQGKKIAVWCAGHFSFTILSVSKVGKDVSYIIDNADFKKGCFAPGSKVPIVGPEHFVDEPVDVIMILGPIYVNEIVEEIKSKCSKNVEIVTIDKSDICYVIGE